VDHQQGREGFDFVCCRVCDGRRSVIGAKHLSPHGFDQETYMAEYRLTPDQLVAKSFRIGQSRRAVYEPLDKRNWANALRAIYKTRKNISTRFLQKNYPHVYGQGRWLKNGDWHAALRDGKFDPAKFHRFFRLDNDEINARIREIRRKDLPLYPSYIARDFKKLFNAGHGRDGSWRKTVVRSNVFKSLRLKPLYRQHASLLKALNSRLQRQSKTERPEYFKNEVEYYFGRLQKGIAEAKKVRNRFAVGT